MENITIPRFFTKADILEIERLKKLSDPYQIMELALAIGNRIVARSPHTLGIVCGPISSGTGTVEEKLERFQRTINLVERKMAVFNQMPFEPLFGVVHEMVKDEPVCKEKGGTSHFFLDYFYEEIFRHEKQWMPHFIHGWELSIGATREHDIFMRKRSPIYYLPPGYDLELK